MAVYRLLITIVERCEEPRDTLMLSKIWKNGLDIKKIIDYLNTWKHRFDIFDEERPFYQVPQFRVGSPTTIRKLMHEKASHNNATLFDHSFDEDIFSISPAESALLLLANQSYAVGGGKSSTADNFRDAPLVGKVPLVLKGKNLGETIRLNLINYDSKQPKVLLTGASGFSDFDLPAWEADQPSAASTKREVRGLLDYYTWQSRAIRLLPELGNGNISVSRMYFSQGVELGDLSKQIIRDPMVPYVYNKKSGIRPEKLDISKSQWRSLPALLHSVPGQIIMPKTIDTVSLLINRGILKKDARLGLEILGLYNNEAKINQWSQSIIPLPSKFIVDNSLLSEMDLAIKNCEAAGNILRKAIDNLTINNGSDANHKQIKSSRDSLNVERVYWSRLESQFYELMDQLASEELPKGAHQRNEMLKKWFVETVHKNAKECFEEYSRSLEVNPKNLKALVTTRLKFYKNLKLEIKNI